VASFLGGAPRAHFLVIGQGPSEEAILRACQRSGAGARVHMAGTLSGSSLADAYRAMDVFAFASKSETQGLVLAEAMASGVPVVGIDASGVREVVDDGRNGRLLADEHAGRFAEALAWTAARSDEEYEALRRAARETAERFSMTRCADRALEIYASLVRRGSAGRKGARKWRQALRRVRAEWDLFKNAAKATGAAVLKKRRGDDRAD
jgi:glycosyltransferase involved in cell wall biosynthesis